MTYNKTNRDWRYRSLLEIVSPQSGKQFPIVTCDNTSFYLLCYASYNITNKINKNTNL